MQMYMRPTAKSSAAWGWISALHKPDTGSISGSASHEFRVLAQSGEDDGFAFVSIAERTARCLPRKCRFTTPNQTRELQSLFGLKNLPGARGVSGASPLTFATFG